MVNEILEKLKVFEDPKFKFDPIKHKYTYDGIEFESVTKFIKKFSKPFDQDYWATVKSEQYGVPKEQILKEWKDKNDFANRIGTETHKWIENYFNKQWQELPNDLDIIKRINKFNVIYAKHLYKLEPVKFEVKIFSKKWKLAGTIDSLFLYKNKLYIIDWKTNGDFTHDEHDKGRYENLLHPLTNYYKNHHNEYSIQISLYALILEEHGIDVNGGYLVHIGPSDEEEAKIYKIIDFREILRNYLNNESRFQESDGLFI